MRIAQPDDGAADFAGVDVDPARYGFTPIMPMERTQYIADCVPRGARLLEVGCGAGAMATLLRDRQDAIVVGLEPQHERAQLARAMGIDVREQYLDDFLAQSTDTFDIVLFADVLEHMVNPAEVLRTAAKALSRGGRVIASVPNVAHWTVRWNLLRGRFDYESSGIMDATHLRWFTEAGIRNLFLRSGYDVDFLHATAGVWLPIYGRRPWYWVSETHRNTMIRRATSIWPRLFGVQFVISGLPRQ